jgi:hypothetical protein
MARSVARWSCWPLAVLVACAGRMAFADLSPLKYNHPGLVVDLGVGLWAWPVPCDADGDGDFDLIVSCPDKPSNGIWLFENADGDTRANKLPVFKPARRLSSAVHYVVPSYVEGSLRVLTPGAEYPEFSTKGLAHRLPLAAPQAIHVPRGHAKGGRASSIRHNEWRYVDYDGDGQLDLVVGIEDWSDYGWDDAFDAAGRWTNGPLHGFVYWLPGRRAAEGESFAEPRRVEAAGKPVDTYGCPTPNFVDFDDDGDLDLLCGEFLDGFSYFQNVGMRTAPRYAAAVPLRTSAGERLSMDLEMIVPIAFDWDRDGDVDLVVGQEDGRVALVENSGTFDAARTPQFLPPRFFQQQADDLKCGALATPVGCDWDGDGDVDLVSGNTAGYIEWFENLSGTKVEAPRWQAPRRIEVDGKPFRVMAGANGSIQGPAEAKWGYTTLSVADWDHDGQIDVVFNSIVGRVQWLRNVGSRARPRFDAPRPIEVDWSGTPPKPEWTWWTPSAKELATQWRTTPIVHDVTGDGLLDLVMLDQAGYLALFERVRRGDRLILLPPRRAFVDAEGKPLAMNPKRAGGSGRRKLWITDWDGDGRFDLLANSQNADLLRQTSSSGGLWTLTYVGPLSPQNIEGHDVSPTTVDFDGNGIPDFVGGAEDGKFYYLRNPRE